jgi:predicted NUDIX family phosphoesterase
MHGLGGGFVVIHDQHSRFDIRRVSGSIGVRLHGKTGLGDGGSFGNHFLHLVGIPRLY